MAKQRTILTTVLCLAAISILFIFGYLSRGYLLETWYLARVDSSRPEEKKAMIEGLARWGCDRAAVKLAELAKGAWSSEAISAEAKVFPRLRSDTRSIVIKSLLDLLAAAGRTEKELAIVLIALGSDHGDLLPIFVEALDSTSEPVRKVAANVIVHQFETNRDAVERLLGTWSVERLLALFLPCAIPPLKMYGTPADFVPDPPPERAREIAAWLGTSHQDPKVRAMALSLQLFQGRTGNDFQYDLKPLVHAYEKDPSPLVKTAAIRLAGALAHRPETLDLPRIILTESDPLLLAEAIEARMLWASVVQDWRQSLELWDGFVCYWIKWGLSAQFKKPWMPEEVDRLQEILKTSRDSKLRDAASFALASRYRKIKNGRSTAPEQVKVPGFKVHEWGVWIDGDKTLMPPDKVFADLPAFVHRSEVLADEIYGERFYTPSFVTKPVVFFHAPEPLSVLLQVGFHEGRPWTFFPAATDYTESVRGQPFVFSTGSAAGPPITPAGDGVARKGPQASSLVDGGRKNVADMKVEQVPLDQRDGISPPWLKPATMSTTPGGDFPRTLDPLKTNPKGLQSFYNPVPWLVPNHPLTPTVTGGGSLVLASLGLEWCGLRVGYGDDLEGQAPPVNGPSWWDALRAVPCDSVAVRGEREKFLFYDGAVNMPGPILASWSDASKTELVLAARQFGEYPNWPSAVEVLSWWWLSEAEQHRFRTTLPIPAVLVVSREEGKETRGKIIENVSPDHDPLRVPLTDLELDASRLVNGLQAVLEAQGLTAEEAGALLATWRKDFFETPGLRVISVLPQWMYNAMLPFEVYPVPEETVRVGLVWRECKDLAMGPGAADGVSEAGRWKPMLWSMPSVYVEIADAPLTPGDKTPLVIREDGEIDIENLISGLRGFSSDGSQLAVVTRDGQTVRILRADLKTKTIQEVLKFEGITEKDGAHATISGDGTRLGFAVKLSSGWQGFIADLGRNQLIKLPSGGLPRLSADGSRVLYEESGPGHLSTLKLLDLEAGKVRTLFEKDVQGGLLCSEEISGDGSKVAFAFEAFDKTGRNREVYLLDLGQETLLNVSRSPEADDDPRLSSNGRKVLFESKRTRDADIFLADIDARTLTNLTHRPGDDRFPAITADGKRIIYRDWDAARFFVVDLDTGAKHEVPGTAHVWTCELSADGKKLLLVKWRGEVPYLCLLDAPPR